MRTVASVHQSLEGRLQRQFNANCLRPARRGQWRPRVDSPKPVIPPSISELISAEYTERLPRIARWEHEDVLDRMQRRLDRMPMAGRIRRQTAKHVFGTLKSWMGATHHVLAYKSG